MLKYTAVASWARHAFGGRLFPVLALSAVLVGISLATRIALLARPDSVLPGGVTPLFGIFGLGFGFDLFTAVYFSTPFVLWLALVPNRLANIRLHRFLVVVSFSAATYLLIVVAVAEWLFWDEFGARFNFIAVDYLLYTHEVAGNIRESYPVGWILAALAVPAVLITMFFSKALAQRSAAPLSWVLRLAVIAVYTLLLVVVYRTVDSDQKGFSVSDTANELGGNGIYEFFAANYRNELQFERFYQTLPPSQAMQIAKQATDSHGGWLENQADGFERYVPAAGPARRLNVVLVSIESMGAEFLGSYGNPGNSPGLTPNLDRLAQNSLWFSNTYATGNRTVRGLEALTLSLPPTPGQSIVRRPKNEGLFSLGSVLRHDGYDTLFAYGGYGYFDNMNAFFEGNGYRVIDRTQIPKEKIAFENIWGVADESLFDHVIAELDRQQAEVRRPFFVHVMTTSNHRPYTYPTGRIDIPSGTGRDGAVKYADWAVGHFLEEAAKHPWFKDTVFVITADHGANARGGIEIPVDKYRIPVFIYGPRHIAPQHVDRLMSQIDVAPTLLGLLGISHYSKFFGRDILHTSPAGDRAFVGNYQTLGYLKDGKIAVLQPKRKTGVFRTDANGKPVAPDQDPALVREAVSLYQSASIVFKSGRFRDEGQLPPERRGNLASSQGGILPAAQVR